MIRVSGFSMERFMNMASYRNVVFWDVQTGGMGMEMKTSQDGLKEMEYCGEKTGCHVEVLGYGGLPAKFRRFRKRQALLYGGICFAGILYLLSSFVWVVEVEGNERLATKEILDACKEMHLYPGVWKQKVDTDAVTKALLANFADISWVSVGIQGTDVTIRLAETIEKKEMVEKEIPCDIVAKQGGVIQKVTAERGTPLVQAGDVVEKGDVLISSEITIGLEGEVQDTVYTTAAGTVTAKIWAELSEELPFTYTEKVFDGREKENHVLLWNDTEIDLIHPDRKTLWKRETIEEKPLALGDFRLPLSLRKEKLRAYENQEKTRTEEQAKKELEKILQKKAKEYAKEKGIVDNIEIQYEVYTDRVRATGTATISLPIGVEKEKGYDAVNGSDGTDNTDGE